jgi:hypothetical protein
MKTLVIILIASLCICTIAGATDTGTSTSLKKKVPVLIEGNSQEGDWVLVFYYPEREEVCVSATDEFDCIPIHELVPFHQRLVKQKAGETMKKGEK